MAFDWLISGDPPLFVFLFAWPLITHWELLISLSLMPTWLLYSFKTHTYWLYWFDPFVYLHILTLLDIWLLCSLWHVHSCCCLSRSSWHDWFSWLYIIVIIKEHTILARYSSQLSYFLLSLCVYLNDIQVFCMFVCCMTSLLPCDCMSCLSMWDTHLSPCLQLSSLGRPCFLWSLVFDMRLVALFALRPS